METLTAVVGVLRALIDAAFSTGGITDAQHVALHGQLDGADPAVAEARKAEQAAADAAAAEDAHRAEFEAWKASQSAAPAGAGTESAGFSG